MTSASVGQCHERIRWQLADDFLELGRPISDPRPASEPISVLELGLVQGGLASQVPRVARELTGVREPDEEPSLPPFSSVTIAASAIGRWSPVISRMPK